MLEKLREERDTLTLEQQALQDKHKQDMETAISQANKVSWVWWWCSVGCRHAYRNNFGEERGWTSKKWSFMNETCKWLDFFTGSKWT